MSGGSDIEYWERQVYFTRSEFEKMQVSMPGMRNRPASVTHG
jgi:hypothetical protein